MGSARLFPEGWRPPFALNTEVGARRRRRSRALITDVALRFVLDVPFQDSPTAPQLDGSVRPGQSEFPRAALHLPSAAREQRDLGAHRRWKAA